MNVPQLYFLVALVFIASAVVNATISNKLLEAVSFYAFLASFLILFISSVVFVFNKLGDIK